VISKTVVTIILALGIYVLLVVASVIGEKNEPVHELLPDATCSDCHICFTPTKKDPCLRPCPRFPEKMSAHTPAEGPEVVILNQLEDLFEPVIFAHKLHAEMAEMGQGCVVCHHYTPPGHISPCRECHGGPLNPEDLRQPGLKGAYHRQCMSCHREWSHTTACAVCHAKKGPGEITIRQVDTTDIVGIYHPRIAVPDKRVYQTNYNKGPVVTFHHKDHVELFGLKCVDCHQEESCSRCHEIEEKPEHLAKTPEEHHKPCISCHTMKTCLICHAQSERKGFDHARTGWPLNRFHQELNCRSCHSPGRKISKLSRDCIACHTSWSARIFNHAVTGLVLDETHQEMDCVDCHLDSRFGDKPSCVNCHDDNRVYPESSPGSFTERTQ